MALTLAEAAKLSNDTLLVGVVETIVNESPVLQVLPFIEVVGNGLTYNREATLPTAGFYDVGDTWTESTPTFTQVTANLKVLGGDADVDSFLAATRSNIQDLEAAVVQLKAKAVQRKFDDTYINGDTAVDGTRAAYPCGYAFFGADRLIYGSDYPFGTEAGEAYIRDNLSGVRAMDLSQDITNKVLGGNAAKLLHLGS